MQAHRPLLATACFAALLLGACDQGGPAPGSEAPALAQRTYEAQQDANPVSDAGDESQTPGEDCADLPDADELKRLLQEAPKQDEAGGFNGGRFEWVAIVNREGVLCAVAVSTDDPDNTWPGSLAIAQAKAFTANAFSSNTTPMSTARQYTLSQPGHSLWGAAANKRLPPSLAGEGWGGGAQRRGAPILTFPRKRGKERLSHGCCFPGARHA